MFHAYKSAILGGTFDHFHLGHERFIAAAFNLSQNITIGVGRGPLLANKSMARIIESYSVRENSLNSFLHKLNVLPYVNIIPINDIYGSSLTDMAIEAIFVTESTRGGAEKINIERHKLGFSPLEIVVVPYLLADDDDIISSRRIRAGEINRQGESYLKFFLQKKEYQLPNNLRPTLQNPIGTILPVKEMLNTIPHSTRVISVGDIVSLNLVAAGYYPAISIIDYRTRRHKIAEKIIQASFPMINQKISNPAGTINKEIAGILIFSLNTYEKTNHPQVIAVSGEEDLLALPAILLSPLGTYVAYGQHDLGMVVVEVTENIKVLVKHYLEQF